MKLVKMLRPPRPASSLSESAEKKSSAKSNATGGGRGRRGKLFGRFRQGGRHRPIVALSKGGGGWVYATASEDDEDTVVSSMKERGVDTSVLTSRSSTTSSVRSIAEETEQLEILADLYEMEEEVYKIMENIPKIAVHSFSTSNSPPQGEPPSTSERLHEGSRQIIGLEPDDGVEAKVEYGDQDEKDDDEEQEENEEEDEYDENDDGENDSHDDFDDDRSSSTQESSNDLAHRSSLFLKSLFLSSSEYESDAEWASGCFSDDEELLGSGFFTGNGLDDDDDDDDDIVDDDMSGSLLSEAADHEDDDFDDDDDDDDEDEPLTLDRNMSIIRPLAANCHYTEVIINSASVKEAEHEGVEAIYSSSMFGS